MSAVAPSPCDLPALEAFARRHRVAPAAIRRFRIDWFKKGASVEEALSSLPIEAREGARRELALEELALVERRDSRVDGASKLVLRTPDGRLIETVILRVASGRTSLCVSSQVGCAAGCTFCATGKTGLLRQLSASEILDQVLIANRLLRPEGRTLRNVVFMGMGEPFHNEEAVGEAVERLVDPRAFGLSPRKILVSTVGVPAAMLRFAERFPAVNLALSLHDARPERRREIVPHDERGGLEDLRETLVALGALRGRPTMIEYVLLEGVNDDEDAVEALRSWIAGLDVHVNLIPWNPIGDDSETRGTRRERREAIAARLKADGHAVTLRYSLGADVAAACGQLVRDENRRGRRGPERA